LGSLLDSRTGPTRCRNSRALGNCSILFCTLCPDAPNRLVALAADNLCRLDDARDRYHWWPLLGFVFDRILTPIWSALLARVWLKEAITRDRTLAIILGTVGLLIVLNLDQGLPIPRNSGDWMALVSGLIWALFANVMRRSESSYDTVDVLFSWFFWATIIAVTLGLLQILDRPDPPSAEQIITVLPWLIPVVLFLIIPGFYAITWGVPLLNPGTVGVLFMTEISVGAISAALLTNEPFGVREILGVILITAAGLTEVVVPMLGTLFSSRSTRVDRNS